MLGAVRAVAGERDHDQPRIERPKHLPAEPEPIHDAGGEVLRRDVRARDEAAREIDSLGCLQIEDDAALPLVELIEIAAAVRSRDAVWPRRQEPRHAWSLQRLDADHFGAEMGELQRRVRSGPDPGEIGDANAGERSHVSVPSRR